MELFPFPAGVREGRQGGLSEAEGRGLRPFGRSLLQKLPEEFRPDKTVIDMAKELDRAYIPTRYPTVHPEGAPYEAYTEADARRLIGYARRIVGYCEGLLSRI